MAASSGEEGAEFIEYTIDGALRMERLLRDLRTYTHVSTAERAPAESVDANEILTQALHALAMAVRESGAAVTADMPPRVPVYEFQVRQLFQNLIGNAIRYRDERPLQIHVGVETGRDEWVFSVRDNEIGIEARFREQIFGIFKRLHPASEHPGTGMGLAICRRIVERAGGRIWVESEPGAGSTFFFTIPFPANSGQQPAGVPDPPDRGCSSGRGIGV